MPMSARPRPRPHPRRLVVALVSGSVLVLGSLAGLSGSARAAGAAFSPSACVTTPSTVVPDVQIDDPACEFNGAAYTGPFSPIANGSGQLSRVWTGIADDGASYRIEVPPNWNGTLVMFAHGYRGTGNEGWIDDPQLRQYFVDNGVAWAASSYAMNGYDPGDGVVDTHDLLEAFPSITGLGSRQVIMSGLSMGGEVPANRAVLRTPVTAPSSADALSPAELPAIHGDPGIPVLSVHGIGDLFVPLAMDQQYDAMMVAHGEGGLFGARAIREVTHCGYTTSELSSAFSALVSWIHTGKRPAGDNILNPKAVASPLFGCQFTAPTPDAHPEFKATVPCPPSTRD